MIFSKIADQPFKARQNSGELKVSLSPIRVMCGGGGVLGIMGT